jgi:hypothetical protein
MQCAILQARNTARKYCKAVVGCVEARQLKCISSFCVPTGNNEWGGGGGGSTPQGATCVDDSDPRVKLAVARVERDIGEG